MRRLVVISSRRSVRRRSEIIFLPSNFEWEWRKWLNVKCLAVGKFCHSDFNWLQSIAAAAAAFCIHWNIKLECVCVCAVITFFRHTIAATLSPLFYFIAVGAERQHLLPPSEIWRHKRRTILLRLWLCGLPIRRRRCSCQRKASKWGRREQLGERKQSEKWRE